VAVVTPGHSVGAKGRPLDPSIEGRVYDAALEVYASGGWGSFTIHAVSTRAKVGKAAIYRRWSSKEDLLVAAILSMGTVPVPNTGSLRGDLIATVRAVLDEYSSARGLVQLRAQVEAKAYPEVFGSAMEAFRRRYLADGRTMLSASIRRGELDGDVDTSQILDAVVGMTINHILAMSNDGLTKLSRDSRRYAESVADFVLKGINSRPPAGEHGASPVDDVG
jgi:AcrR family transcriptional regulator